VAKYIRPPDLTVQEALQVHAMGGGDGAINGGGEAAAEGEGATPPTLALMIAGRYEVSEHRMRLACSSVKRIMHASAP